MTKQVKKSVIRSCKAGLAVQSVKPVIKTLPHNTARPIFIDECNLPEFKPGNTPYMQYGNQVLNENVAWNEVISDLCSHGLSMVEIAVRLDVDVCVVQAVTKENYAQLNFKTGARLLALHMQYTMKIV